MFWQDYYNYGLAQNGTPYGIDTLVQVHEQWAAGTTSVLHVDDDLYIMQRNGAGSQKGLVFVLNTSANWKGVKVKTNWPNTTFRPKAWNGKDQNQPNDVGSQNDGTGDFWAAPRGYAVYVPA